MRPLALLLLLAACIEREGPPTPTGGHATVASGPVLAVYMVGGNVEDSAVVRGSWQEDEGHVLPRGTASKWGAGSDDLRELVAGAAALPPEARERLTVWVAFGGARKAGWRGIRYADLACLTADGGDEVFGNADCYAFVDDKADLSQPEPLAAFLKFMHERLGHAGPNVLVLWGQGGAHEGWGYDTIHQEMPFMRLPIMATAMATATARVQSWSRFDVLAWDAPLMGSLEAIAATGGLARLVVASPDRMPGHGFDYRALVRDLGARGATGDALARQIADRFIDGESLTLDAQGGRVAVPHRQSRGKTISVIDASQLRSVEARLDGLVVERQPLWSRLATVLDEQPVIGRERMTDNTEAIDLQAAASAVRSRIPELATATAALEHALDRFVVHHREDPDRLFPARLSIFAPLADKLWRSSYQNVEAVPPGWREFLAAQLDHAATDTQAPAMRPGRRGQFVVSDDDRLRAVEVLRTESVGPGLWRAWASAPAPVVSAAPDGRTRTVGVPSWDGRIPWLSSGTAAGTPVPAHREGTLPNGHLLLSAAALVRDVARQTDGEEATLFLELDGDGVADAWVTPLELDTEGRVMFSREQYRLERGLSIAFHLLEKTDPAVPAHYGQTAFYDLEAPPRWRLARLDKPLQAQLAASDLHHNRAYWRAIRP